MFVTRKQYNEVLGELRRAQMRAEDAEGRERRSRELSDLVMAIAEALGIQKAGQSERRPVLNGTPPSIVRTTAARG